MTAAERSCAPSPSGMHTFRDTDIATSCKWCGLVLPAERLSKNRRALEGLKRADTESPAPEQPSLHKRKPSRPRIARFFNDAQLGAVLRRFLLSDEYTDLLGDCLVLDGNIDLSPNEIAIIERLIAERGAIVDKYGS